MNLQETLALIEALKSAGVTKFKSLEHDISLDARAIAHNEFAVKNPVQPADIKPPIVENKEATEKLKELISDLKLSDEDLVNKLFPDGAL